MKIFDVDVDCTSVYMLLRVCQLAALTVSLLCHLRMSARDNEGENVLMQSAISAGQVYDVRMTARMLTLLPFNAGPEMLRFHPAFSGTLLLASSSGIFSLADAQGTSQYAQTYQVGTHSMCRFVCMCICTSALSYGCAEHWCFVCVGVHLAAALAVCQHIRFNATPFKSNQPKA